MSGDAVRHVRACTHPEVKGSVRAFYDAIARSIPEGQTTTPPLTLEALATIGQQVDRTARTNRDFLEAIGEVKVHDGGRGRKTARYEMLQLTSGARPITAPPLPLRADLRAAAPVVRRDSDQRSDLFADVETQRSDQIADVPKRSDLFADVWEKVGSFCRRLARKVGSDVAKVGNLIRRLRPLPPGDQRARDVLPLKESTTTTAAPADPPRPREVKPPPCRSFGTAHAWCDGRQHMPMAFHREERRRLARQPGETDENLDQRLFARYAEILAAIPDTEPIRDTNEFVFWKRVLRSPARGSTAAPRRDGVTGSNCPHDPMCIDTRACIGRTIADGRAERERKSG